MWMLILHLVEANNLSCSTVLCSSLCPLNSAMFLQPCFPSWFTGRLLLVTCVVGICSKSFCESEDRVQNGIVTQTHISGSSRGWLWVTASAAINSCTVIKELTVFGKQWIQMLVLNDFLNVLAHWNLDLSCEGASIISLTSSYQN